MNFRIFSQASLFQRLFIRYLCSFKIQLHWLASFLVEIELLLKPLFGSIPYIRDISRLVDDHLIWLLREKWWSILVGIWLFVNENYSQSNAALMDLPKILLIFGQYWLIDVGSFLDLWWHWPSLFQIRLVAKYNISVSFRIQKRWLFVKSCGSWHGSRINWSIRWMHSW
jgi:hypothetical protein